MVFGQIHRIRTTTGVARNIFLKVSFHVKKELRSQKIISPQFPKSDFSISSSRKSNGGSKEESTKNTNLALYLGVVVVSMVGLSYAAVPLYQLFCQHFGIGGTTQQDSKLEKLRDWKQEGAETEREIEVTFTANTNYDMPWKFWPTQRSLKVKVGETALAFFTAHNTSTEPVVGVATYNVMPMRAGLYFNKIQCFCFDEQRLRGGEHIDMPVFFFLDPALLQDHKMDKVKEIALSYTFFPSSDWDEDENDGGQFLNPTQVQKLIESKNSKAE